MPIRETTLIKLARRLRASVGVLFVGREVALSFLRKYLVRKLNESGDLEGDIGKIELHLFRGIIVFRDVSIAKKSNGNYAVAVSCPEIALQFQWFDLWQGALVGRVQARAPHIEVLAEEKKDATEPLQTEGLEALCRESQRFMPFRLQFVDVTDGLIEYRSGFTSPPFKLALEKIFVHAANLTNIPSEGPAQEAHVALEGETTGHGKFWLQLWMPSLTEVLTFELQAGVNHVNLVELNDFFRASAKFDLKRGVCSVYTEFEVERGVYQGYIQPHFKNLDLFAWQKEHGKSFFQICRQAAIAMFASVFKSKPRDELALKIPVSGNFADPDVDVWAAIASLLKNAFVRSLIPEFRNESSKNRGRWSLPFWRKARPHADI